MTAGLDMPAAPRESAALVPAAAFQAHGAAIVLVALAALGAETALLALSGELQPWMLLGGHGLVSLAVAGWVRAGRRQSSPHAALLAVVTTAFGPFGPAGVLLSLALGRHYARLATPMDEWHAMLFPPTRPDENAELWRRIGQRASDLSGEQHVTPFLDVLAFGSIPQRQSVIAIIAQQFHPSFAPALKAALCDPHNVIRVQAATAIARLENEFLERTMRLEAAAREAPDDPAAVLALAGHYDDQAFAGLLDPTREGECRVKAADGYERYLRRHPDDHSVRFRLARLQQRRGLSADAERLFREAAGAGAPGAGLWLVENLFEQGRYAELRDVAAAQPAHQALPEASAAIALWAGRESPA